MNSDRAQNVKIFARIRGLMPWEPRKVSLAVSGNSITNKTRKIINSYSFNKVYLPHICNSEIHNSMVMPMINNVLKGFNAMLICYGQSGSGKTYTICGKPRLGIIGLLSQMLSHMANCTEIYKVELSAIEVFGRHNSKIFLFDLFDSQNQIKKWKYKKGSTTLDIKAVNKVTILSEIDAFNIVIKYFFNSYYPLQLPNDIINLIIHLFGEIPMLYSMAQQKTIYASNASHIAPIGTNPQSSRGHIVYITKIWHKNVNNNKHRHGSYFVMVDCAGSEGDTSFSKAFKANVSAETLLLRRLESGIINTGLSQLQIIFKELREKGKLSHFIGNGLRKVLHSFIHTKTYLSMIFTVSPSVNNAKSTEGTLKFAAVAGLFRVRPTLCCSCCGQMNWKKIIIEKKLKPSIIKQEMQINYNKNKINILNEKIKNMENFNRFIKEIQERCQGKNDDEKNNNEIMKLALKEYKILSNKWLKQQMFSKESMNEVLNKLQDNDMENLLDEIEFRYNQKNNNFDTKLSVYTNNYKQLEEKQNEIILNTNNKYVMNR